MRNENQTHFSELGKMNPKQEIAASSTLHSLYGKCTK